MRLVVIESPYAGDTPEAIRANVDYGRRCLADSLSRGEAPFASHLLYTQPGVLDDANPGQRSIGIAAGLQWGAASNLTAVYYDRGLSKGMKEGLRNAMRLGLRVELRSLEGRETLIAARCPDGSGYELRSPNWQAALLGAEVESFVLLIKNWVDGALASSPRPAKRPHLMDEMKAEAEKIETAQLVRLGSAEMWDALNEFAALFRGRAAKAAASEVGIPTSEPVDKQRAVFAAYARINAPQGTKESIAFIRGAEWQAEHHRLEVQLLRKDRRDLFTAYEKLIAEADELRKKVGDLFRARQVLGATKAALETEVERLRALLSEAADEILNWGSYASEYFQEKHDLAGCVGKYRAAALAGEEAQE